MAVATQIDAPVLSSVRVESRHRIVVRLVMLIEMRRRRRSCTDSPQATGSQLSKPPLAPCSRSILLERFAGGSFTGSFPRRNLL